MTLDWATAQALASEHGRSFFLLDAGRFRHNFAALREAFEAHYPDVNIGYSYKTNYTPQLCRIVNELGGFAEIVSSMEYELARRIGVSGERIIFNGPYKGAAAFKEAALSGATLNLDSARDLTMLREIAPDAAGSINVVLRCNFALNDDDVSRFGLDVEGLEFAAMLDGIAQLPAVVLKGLHCHFPDRDLASFGRRADRLVALVNRLFPDTLPEILNIGGGYFSNMPDSLRQSFAAPPASFADYGALVGARLTKGLAGRGKLPALFLEPGTALVADTQQFYTQVVSTKSIRGHNFATVAGSSFDISPTARSRNLPVTPILQKPRSDDGKTFDIVGYTCIEKDILSESLRAPLVVDDFVCYDNVGSYSVVMRPPFILPANPILMKDGQDLRLIKERQTTDEVFQNFRFA